MSIQLWRDVGLGEKILAGDRCCDQNHQWFEIKEDHLTFRDTICAASRPTQRKVNETCSKREMDQQKYNNIRLIELIEEISEVNKKLESAVNEISPR